MQDRIPTACLAGAITMMFAALPAIAEPLYTKNLSPVAGLLGLPAQRGVATTGAGHIDIGLHGAVASHYINANSDSEFVNFDGETRRLTLDLRYGMAGNWDLQLEVPWLEHAGGELDRVIDEWHDIWGMSDGGRSDVARDLLDFRYATRTHDVGLAQSASGIGDLSVSLSRAFYRTQDAAAALALGYKFDTGDARKFTGSGAGDVFLALRMSGNHLSELPVSWHGQMGYLRAGDSDLLGDRQRRDLWFAGIAMDWRFAANWSAILQLDSHRGPLDSALTATGEDAFLLTVGGRWRVARRWAVDFSVIEDIRVASAPDVTFQVGLRFRTGD